MIRKTDYVNQWTKENDFVFLEYYWVRTGFHRMFMAVWQRTDRLFYVPILRQSGLVS